MTRSRACVAVWLSLAATAALGSRVQTWSETGDSLLRGRAEGMAVGPRDELSRAPRLSRLGGADPLPGAALHAWSLVSEGERDFLVGTGPAGSLIRVGAAGRPEVFSSLSLPMITALAVLPDGSTLAGTAPGGRLYRIDRGAAARVFAETGRRYAWVVARDAAGELRVATGEPGGVVRVAASGRVEPVFDCEEPHVVALAPGADGTWLAGGAGLGRVYRIDAVGRATVLYDDELAEVVDLVEDADGSVVAALAAAPVPEARRPALRIELPRSVDPAAPAGPTAAFADEDGSIVRGVIEGLAGSDDRAPSRQTGRVVRIAPDGTASVLWRSGTEIPFALARDGTGRIVFGSGEPARLWQVEPGDRGVSLLASLAESQVTALAPGRSSIALATSNPPALYRLGVEPGDGATFVSRPIDAGSIARWGLVEWTASGDRVEMSTRTGTSSRPDSTWSDWTIVTGSAGGGRVTSPDARYLQWRARFRGPPSDADRLSGLRIAYEPYNRPPVLRELYLDAPAGAVNGDATFRFSTHDPDQDATVLELELRGPGGGDWTRIAGRDSDSPGVEWRDDRVILRTADFAEGKYEIRATLHDEPGNPPGAAARIVDPMLRTLIVDRTAPTVDLAPSGGAAVQVEVTDSVSALQRVEVLERGRVVFALRPEDGLCDSPRESFRFVPPPQLDPRDTVVRAVDAAGNKMEAPLPAR